MMSWEDRNAQSMTPRNKMNLEYEERMQGRIAYQKRIKNQKTDLLPSNLIADSIIKTRVSSSSLSRMPVEDKSPSSQQPRSKERYQRKIEQQIMRPSLIKTSLMQDSYEYDGQEFNDSKQMQTIGEEKCASYVQNIASPIVFKKTGTKGEGSCRIKRGREFTSSVSVTDKNTVLGEGGLNTKEKKSFYKDFKEGSQDKNKFPLYDKTPQFTALPFPAYPLSCPSGKNRGIEFKDQPLESEKGERHPNLLKSSQIVQNQVKPPEQNFKILLKEVQFPPPSFKNSKMAEYQQGLCAPSPEERKKILKKILAHFSIKVNQIEKKQFMNVFGLEIKQLPPKKFPQPFLNQGGTGIDWKRTPSQAAPFISSNVTINCNNLNYQNINLANNLNYNQNLIGSYSNFNSHNNSRCMEQRKVSYNMEDQLKSQMLSENFSLFKDRIIERKQQQNQIDFVVPEIVDQENIFLRNQQIEESDDGGGDGEEVEDNKINSKSGKKELKKLSIQGKNALQAARAATAGKRQVNQNFKFALSDYNIQREEAFIRKNNGYKDFLFKINYSNHLFVNLLDEAFPYRVCVGAGNNAKLIKTMFRSRWWWQLVDFDQKLECNFLWTQSKLLDFYTLQEDSVSTLAQQGEQQNNNLGTSKASLVMLQIKSQNSISSVSSQMHASKSSTQSPQKSMSPKIKKTHLKTEGKSNQKPQQQQQQQVDHNQKILSGEDLEIYKKYTLSQNGQRDYLTQNWEDLNFRLKHLKKPYLEQPYKIIEPNLKTNISHNHLQCNYHLGNKKALFYNMRSYYSLMKDDVFNYLPLTYHLNKGTEDKEFRPFIKKYKEIEALNEKNPENIDPKKIPKNIWIVKPGEITNRGNGIQVCNTLGDIKKILKSSTRHSNGKPKTYIIQKYIDRPFLYNKRKFDIRAYMLITCVNGIIKAYWYQEGYIRTSGREFNLNNVKDVFIHLTNDAIQKDCQEYNKFEQGNKLSYSEFQKYLDYYYSDQKYNLVAQVVPKMKAIATDAVRSAFLKLDPSRKQSNFEIFGLDFMVDENLKPYLIEINVNPAIETTCPICLKVIPPMIENAFRIGLDPIFPPPRNWPGQKKSYAPDMPIENNRFEIIFDELFDGTELRKIYSNQENCCKKYDYFLFLLNNNNLPKTVEGMNDIEEEEEIDDEGDDKDETTELEYE